MHANFNQLCVECFILQFNIFNSRGMDFLNQDEWIFIHGHQEGYTRAMPYVDILANKLKQTWLVITKYFEAHIAQTQDV